MKSQGAQLILELGDVFNHEFDFDFVGHVNSSKLKRKALVPEGLSPNCCPYRNSSIHSSSTLRLGRVTSCGKVASGLSVIFTRSMKLGALVLT